MLVLRYTFSIVNEFSRKRSNLSIRYGFIAGLFFSLAAWGMDAIILTRYHATLPFLKFLPALLICLPASVLAGYLTAKFENGMIGLIIWGGLAILFTFLVINLPLKFVPWYLNRIRPEVGSILNFEELINLGVCWFYCLFPIGITCLLCGLLENVLIDQSLASSSTLGNLLPLIVCLAIMTASGMSGDSLMTRQFRKPIVVIDTLLQNGADYYNQEVDKQEARKMHLSIVRPLNDLVLQQRSLTLVDVDGYLSVMKVLVDFNGESALCHTVYSQPTFCEIIKPKFNGDQDNALGVKQNSRIDIYNNDIINLRIFSATLAT
ncbi:MAG TPA: hypothetical protein PLO13_02105 [Anaerolineaceae bacterium]|nr:hypothetical protein [Anaerolineaceae bacterium]